MLKKQPSAAFRLTALAVVLFHCMPAFSQLRYRDEIFSSVRVETAVQFGQNKNIQGVLQPLFLDCFQPAGNTEPKRPLLIWIHGGGFVGENRHDAKLNDFCQSFARRGYVTATIDYRIGVESPQKASQFAEAMLRAVQDGKAAVRFFRHRAEWQR